MCHLVKHLVYNLTMVLWYYCLMCLSNFQFILILAWNFNFTLIKRQSRVEGKFKREEKYVYLWLIHIDVWQKPNQYSKAIILQLKINVVIFKKEIHSLQRQITDLESSHKAWQWRQPYISGLLKWRDNALCLTVVPH